jgi:hypothetical protein
MTINCKQQMKYFFLRYKYGNFIRIQGWILATTFATTMHTNMFTHGSLRMWHIVTTLYRVWGWNSHSRNGDLGVFQDSQNFKIQL